MMFIFSFSIFFVCLAVVLLIPCVNPLWDSAAVHSPSGKELHPSSQEVPVFQGVAPWHTIVLLSCVIPLWDSATAHSPFGKELLLSSLKQSCFSGLIVVWCSNIILTGLSLVWCSPILLTNPINAFILFHTIYSKRPQQSKYFTLCVVYFYSERPPLCRGVSPKTLMELAKYFFLRKKLCKVVFWFTTRKSRLRTLYCDDTWTSRYYSF